MASAFITTCSNCSARIELQDESLIGTEVRCPSCGKPFVVPTLDESNSADEPDPIDDGGFYDDPEDKWDEDWNDDFEWGDDLGLDVESEPLSPPRPSKGTSTKKNRPRKRKRRKQRRKRIPPIAFAAMVGGGILFSLLFGLGLYSLLPLMQRTDVADRLMWLPNDTQTYVEVHVADIWEADVLRSVRSNEIGQEIKQKLTEFNNFEIHDFERIVVGSPTATDQTIVVVYASRPISVEMLGPIKTTFTYAGKTLYESEATGDVAFLANETTVVVGTKEMLQSAIDRKGVCTAAEEFAFLPTHGDVIVGSITPGNELETLTAGMMGTAFDPEPLTHISASLSFSRSLKIETTMGYRDGESAATSLKDAQANLVEFQQHLQDEQEELQGGYFLMNRGQRSSNLKMQTILKSVNFSHSGRDLTLEVQLPESIIEDMVESSGGMGDGVFVRMVDELRNPF